jgi:hypothetical protein
MFRTRAMITPRTTWITTFVSDQNRLKTRIRRKSKLGRTMLLSRILAKLSRPTNGGAAEPGRRFLSWKSVNDIQTWKASG